jgi:acetolactate synthase-1/2/3 large subunit
LRIAEAIIETLKLRGVDTIFGVPGGQTLALYDAIARGDGSIRHVTVLDERSGSYAADAYARASGRLGVCDGTVGPGATNLISGLAEALNSSTPVLAIVSELLGETIHLSEYGSASQGSDQVDLLRPVCKKVYAVREAHEAPYLLNRAISAAVGGRPGPVALIVPMDIFEKDFEAPRLGSVSLEHAPPAPRFMAEPQLVQDAAQLAIASARPLILAGGGVVAGGADEALLSLARLLDAPVATTWTGKGAISEEDPLALGVLGASAGLPGTEAVAREADLVIMIGAKSAQNSSFRWTFPSADQKLIHIDIDPLEMGRVFRTEVGLVGQADLVVAQLVEAIGALGGRRDATGWRDACARAVKAAREDLAEQMASEATPIAPQRVVAEIAAVCGPEDVLVCDASFSSAWGAMFFPVRKAGRRCIFPRGMAGIGFGLPAALGAAAARRDAQVFLLAGDGGFAYSAQELAVARHHGLKVRAVVINNGAYGWIKHSYRARFGGSLPQNQLPAMDYRKVAEGFGCVAFRVEDPADLARVLREASAVDGPALIEVITSAEESPVTAHRKDARSRDPYGNVVDPYAAKAADAPVAAS